MYHRSNARHVQRRAPRLSHRKKFWLLLVGLPLLMVGSAYAYFAINQATSHVNVASAPDFFISIAQPTGTPLAPGVGSETVLFSVVNQQSQPQTLNGETYALTTDLAGGVYDTNTNAFVDSCLASWFTITGTPGTGVTFPTTLQPGGAIYTGSITVTMPADPNDDQTSCAGLAPQVSVAVH